MSILEGLKKDIEVRPEGKVSARGTYLARGYRESMGQPNVIARAHAFRTLLEDIGKPIYEHDLIAGSVRGLLSDTISKEQEAADAKVVSSYGSRSFFTNYDHFAPDYFTFLKDGVGGTLKKIDASLAIHTQTEENDFLNAARITMNALSDFIKAYARSAEASGHADIADTCRSIITDAPTSFRQALQLMWFCHISFCLQGRYAMAIGRMDQFLYPFYERDINEGKMTRNEALELVCCTLYKIHEARYFGGDDVVNIAIGGVKPDGSDAINELSYIILEAVGLCNVPGPNLSARLHKDAPERFLNNCLEVIGTGLGYPALMNDEINIPALARHGYKIEDARNYCMVGCIENFISGMQPPWTDGRYNTPKYIELALNNGVCMLTGTRMGPQTGRAESFECMDDFMRALVEQMEYGAEEYMMYFRNENERYNPLNYQQPFLSCFCRDCIGRAKDICRGGSVYPSVHGACGMGIATVTDSLSVIEKLVFEEKKLTCAKLRDILRADFQGYEKERRMMLEVPKYGNDCPKTDKYAVWFVEIADKIFSKYRTHDGGAIYTAIASNIQNISAGKLIGATPDGRRSGEPVSDAASPMHGLDKKGPTAVINSVTRPDYRLVSCGTVLNQKYGPEMFTDPEKRAKLVALIRTYFKKGGQEIQINSVSREVLTDAMEHPEKYGNLVVRVSGFSAYYTRLGREVQKDILKRTEQQ